MFPISYISFPLTLLLFIDRDLASLFYPYIVFQSVFGIVVLLFLMFSRDARHLFKQIFPYSASNTNVLIHNKTMFYVINILFKTVLLFIWPLNLTYDAFMYSTILLLSYFVLYGTMHFLHDACDQTVTINADVQED